MIGVLSASGARDRRITALRAPVTPSWSVNPTTGGATQGQSTAATSGTYDGTQPIVPSYQWREAATSGGTYSDISGATSATSPQWSASDVSTNPWKRCRVTLTGPTGLTATYDTTAVQVAASSPPGAGTATLTWIASEDTNVTGYKVYWGGSAWSETYNSGTISGRTTVTYTATGLEAGRVYFKIRPLFSGGEGEDISLGYVDIV